MIGKCVSHGMPTLGPPFPGLSATTVTGIELVGATILVTVLVFGGCDRHRDVKPPNVAGIGMFWCHVYPDSRKFPTFFHMRGNFPSRTWHKKLARRALHDCLCFFAGAGLQTVRTGTGPTTQPQGRGGVGC